MEQRTLLAPDPVTRRISSVIIALNEAPRIGAAIESLRSFSDEIVIVDGGSTDGTPEIAEKLGCTVHRNPWPGYSAQRNYAAEKASHDWIFFIDADEVVGRDLADAIRAWKSAPDDGKEGRVVIRMNDFLGRWMSTEGITRLYDRRRHRVADVLQNEEVVIPNERLGSLEGILWHYGFRSIAEHATKFGRYTDTDAADLHSRRVRFSIWRLLLRPPARFLQRYLRTGMWRRGVPGLAVCYLWAYYEILKELKLYEAEWRSVGGEQGRHEPPLDPP